MPIDKKTARPRTRNRARRHGRRGRRRSRRGRSGAARPARPAARHRRRAARLAQERARRQPDRHPCPRHSARIFPRGARRSRRRARGVARRPRGLARRCLRHHRSARRQGSRRRRPCACPIPIRKIPAAISSASPSPMSRITCGPARRSTARRCAAAIRSIFPTASCRCCRSASPTTCARCGRNEDRPALAVRMVIGADGRKRSHSFHRVLIRSAARLHYEQAQVAVSGRTDEVTEPIASNGPRAALRRLSSGAARARRARPARSRPSGTQDRAQIRRHRRSRDHAAAAGSAPADRGVHDPRQCRRRRNLRARECAADLSRARRAVAGKAQCAARIPGDARHFAAEGRRAAAGRLQPHPCARQRPRRRAAGQRSGAAHAGAGRIFGGELRPFRPQSAPLCALHLADPPLCRSRRASRPDPRRTSSAPTGCRTAPMRARSAKSPPIFPPPNAAP